MRIALLTYSTRPRGGVVHTLALADALAAAGHGVEVWTLARDGDASFFRAVDPTVTVRVVPFESREGEAVGARIVRSIAVMGAALRGLDADVVHAQDCISANAALTAGLSPVRTVHHLDDFTTPELRACHDRAVRLPRALLCVSAAVAEEVREGWGRLPTVIPNGVDAARFAAAASDPLTSQWRSQLGRYVLALGGIEPRKGSTDLLEAWAILRDRGHDVALVFGGGETLFDYRDYRAEFDRRAVSLGADPLILGTIPEERLAALVAGASALGFVSVKEGFGLAAMEALAAGVPVVARELPVIREVFGDTVRYGSDPESFADALEAALDGGGGSAAGRELAFSHSWDDVAAQHVRFYGRLLGADPGLHS
ncbi:MULTISPECIES: MSMEG_0565 family glycosyltransferase [unclassified Rathayibacter]|uniref:MSMEG_0565 family glycosyltransferase n=1 Tax=unclassified Rathayibacter TaxID=2609250 RepID=UPI00188CD7E2|nr:MULTISPECIES: MSMEG_0565 family glycosyltransferase [unclassified Rathayibacter]MBF4461045.1 MSMEG_0565 family glycosyltransferase [Rathayibacter sp. VKM Ac-2879]MBF4502456.1 MSMEG_0565 family glycosyltransferase [Rathayibacter sp. VKM Ac-2878]